MILGYGGTLGVPEVFEALCGKKVKWETKTVDGLELVFQSMAQMSPNVRNIMEQNWEKWMFYGAFSLKQREGAKASVTFYEIDDDFYRETVEPRLADWNMHESSWFRFDRAQCTIDGKEAEFMTERLIGDEFLGGPPRGFRTNSRYLRFLTKMLERLKDTYLGPVEGQHFSVERQ